MPSIFNNARILYLTDEGVEERIGDFRRYWHSARPEWEESPIDSYFEDIQAHYGKCIKCLIEAKASNESFYDPMVEIAELLEMNDIPKDSAIPYAAWYILHFEVDNCSASEKCKEAIGHITQLFLFEEFYRDSGEVIFFKDGSCLRGGDCGYYLYRNSDDYALIYGAV